MHKVKICGLDTNTLPKLTQDECLELFNRQKTGDTEAKEKFVRGNIRLVLSVVQRFSNKGNSDDLFQVGMLGLMKAINGFDTKYNVKFSTYAVPMILGEIRRFVKENTGIKVSRNMRDIAYKVLKTREMHEKEHQYTPSFMEIAQEIDIPLKDVINAMDAVSETISLQENVYSDEEDSMTLMEQLSDSKQNDELWTQNLALSEAINSLPGREKEVLVLRYYIGKTQMEISDRIGISQAQVSRLEKNAIEKIRAFM